MRFALQPKSKGCYLGSSMMCLPFPLAAPSSSLPFFFPLHRLEQALFGPPSLLANEGSLSTSDMRVWTLSSCYLLKRGTCNCFPLVCMVALSILLLSSAEQLRPEQTRSQEEYSEFLAPTTERS
jgi:hypothetical protein